MTKTAKPIVTNKPTVTITPIVSIPPVATTPPIVTVPPAATTSPIVEIPPSKTTPPTMTPEYSLDSNVKIHSNSVEASNIGVKVEQMESGSVLFTLKNNNDKLIQHVSFTYELQDETGMNVRTVESSFDQMEAGDVFYDVDDFVDFDIDVSSSDVSLSVSDMSFCKNQCDNVYLIFLKEPDQGISLYYINDSSEGILCLAVVFFYDKEGKMVDAKPHCVGVDANDVKSDIAFGSYYRYDRNGHEAYTDIEYTSYDVRWRAFSFTT